MERSIAFVDGDKDSCVAEAYDVGLSISSNVAKQARVLPNLPASRPNGHIVQDDRAGGIEGTIPPSCGNDNIILPKADDVQEPISSNVSEETEMAICPPPLVVSKVVQGKDLGPKVEIPVVLRHEHPRTSESDDIDATGLPQIRHKPRVEVDAPGSSICMIPIIPADESSRLEGIVAVVLCDEDTSIPKPNQVRSAVSGNISNEANMLIDTPPASIVGEIVEDTNDLLEDTVAQDQDLVQAETDDVSGPCTLGRYCW